MTRARTSVRLRNAFLSGYFGRDRRSEATLAAYESLVWLDRWSGMLAAGPDHAGSGHAKAIVLSITNAFFRRELELRTKTLQAGHSQPVAVQGEEVSIL